MVHLSLSLESIPNPQKVDLISQSRDKWDKIYGLIDLQQCCL